MIDHVHRLAEGKCCHDFVDNEEYLGFRRGGHCVRDDVEGGVEDRSGLLRAGRSKAGQLRLLARLAKLSSLLRLPTSDRRARSSTS